MAVASSTGGLLLVAKPAGVTSHDVVQRVRQTALARGVKVGHAGTLDPFATGLLLVLVGRSTRLMRYLVGMPKSYRAEAQFGATSDSGDRDGELSATGARTDHEQVACELSALRGMISQKVPMASAVSVRGERLYKKARRGEMVETPVREVEIDRFELIDFDDRTQRATLEVDCSSGTYIRQLVEDLGARCGCGAYCAELQRSAIGPFELADADSERLVDPSLALSFMPERGLSSDEAELVQDGVSVEAGRSFAEATMVRLTEGGRLIAVAESRDDVLRPVTVVGAR